MYAFIFMGRSGCGKGTQVSLLQTFLATKDKTPILHIESGPMFRDFILGEKYTNKHSREIYDNDDLQPSFLGCFMWTKSLLENATGNEHIIFDGVARTLVEAKVLETAFEFYGITKTFVINLEVSREWSERRLLARGRADDSSLEKIDKRLNWFEEDTMKAISYYEESPDYEYIAINGEQTVEKVHKDIAGFLTSKLNVSSK